MTSRNVSMMRMLWITMMMSRQVMMVTLMMSRNAVINTLMMSRQVMMARGGKMIPRITRIRNYTWIRDYTRVTNGYGMIMMNAVLMTNRPMMVSLRMATVQATMT
jgi:hypothetical protein